jgi:hypothetical protein
MEGVGDARGEGVVTPFGRDPCREVWSGGLVVAGVRVPSSGRVVVWVNVGGAVVKEDVGVGAVDVVVEQSVAHLEGAALETRMWWVVVRADLSRDDTRWRGRRRRISNSTL